MKIPPYWVFPAFLTGISFLFAPDISAQSRQEPFTVSLKKGLNAERVTDYGTFWHDPHQGRHLVGVPEGLDTVMYWVCPMSEDQFAYEQYKYGEYYGRFKEDGGPFPEGAYDRLGIDPGTVTDLDIRYKIHAVSGLKNGKKIIIMDADNDGDLSNDAVMELDTAMSFDDRLESYEHAPFTIIHYELYKDGQVIPREKIVRIKPLLNMIPSPGKFIEDMRISLTTNEYYYGALEIGKSKYKITASNFVTEPLTINAPPKVRVSHLDTTLRTWVYEMGKIQWIDDVAVRLDSIDLDRQLLWGAILHDYQPAQVGPWERMTPPNIQSKDLAGKDFNLESLRGKHVLLTFWGAWCGPCKGDHPALKAMMQEYQSRDIEFVGIAVDRKKEIVEDYLKNNGIGGTTLYFDINRFSAMEEPIANDYQVSGFPTYILLDPEGRILVRGYLRDVSQALKLTFP